MILIQCFLLVFLTQFPKQFAFIAANSLVGSAACIGKKLQREAEVVEFIMNSLNTPF